MKRIGFFTRLLDDVPAADRYRLALAQIVAAERCGFDTAWVAQHHFHGDEGGLPSPFVFLAAAAAATTRIRLGTGIVTLPLEIPIRVAEDAAVFDLLSAGRLEAGMGPGGNMSAFTAFGLASAGRHDLYRGHLQMLRDAWAGRALPGGDRLYPPALGLNARIWQASFTVDGAGRAGADGDGLMLSRAQPRAPGQSLADVQNRMIDAYLAALPAGHAPRILASRTIFPTDDRVDAWRFAGLGLPREEVRKGKIPAPVADLVRDNDVHLGTVADVVTSLSKDATLARATDVSMQVHSIDPPHEFILRALELFAGEVAPAMGWSA